MRAHLTSIPTSHPALALALALGFASSGCTFHASTGEVRDARSANPRPATTAGSGASTQRSRTAKRSTTERSATEARAQAKLDEVRREREAAERALAAAQREHAAALEERRAIRETTKLQVEAEREIEQLRQGYVRKEKQAAREAKLEALRADRARAQRGSYERGDSAGDARSAVLSETQTGAAGDDANQAKPDAAPAGAGRIDVATNSGSGSDVDTQDGSTLASDGQGQPELSDPSLRPEDRIQKLGRVKDKARAQRIQQLNADKRAARIKKLKEAARLKREASKRADDEDRIMKMPASKGAADAGAGEAHRSGGDGGAKDDADKPSAQETMQLKKVE